MGDTYSSVCPPAAEIPSPLVGPQVMLAATRRIHYTSVQASCVRACTVVFVGVVQRCDSFESEKRIPSLEIIIEGRRIFEKGTYLPIPYRYSESRDLLSKIRDLIFATRKPCVESDSRTVSAILQGGGDKTKCCTCAVTFFAHEMGADRWRLNLATGPSKRRNRETSER